MSSRSLSAFFKNKSKSRSPAPPQNTASSDVEPHALAPSPSPEPAPSNDSMETLVNPARPPAQPTRGRTPRRQTTSRNSEHEFGMLAGTYGLGGLLQGPAPVNPPGFKSKKAEKAAKAARKGGQPRTKCIVGR